VFIKDEEYHGNPDDPDGGAPVTWHYGYDIINFIENESKLQTVIERIDSPSNGIVGNGYAYIDVFISKKE
jgi:hypothetical protein